MKKTFTMALVSLVALGLCAGCEFNISKEGSKSNSNSNVVNTDCSSKEYKQSDFIGVYMSKGTKEVDVENKKERFTYYLTFYEDGTYAYSAALSGPGGHMGSYVVNGDKIILYPIFETGADATLRTVKENVKYELSISSKDELGTLTLTDKDAASMKKTTEENNNIQLRKAIQTSEFSR